MKNPIPQLIQYLKDSVRELKKVTWPTKKETTNYTILVIMISLSVAVFIGLVDFLLSLSIEQVIK